MDVLLVADVVGTKLTGPLQRPVWQPTRAECEAAGVEINPQSVVLKPNISAEIIASAREELSELVVRADDTRSSLIERLRSSEVLDDQRVPLKGKGTGGRTERLNATAKPQPRRVSYSVRGSDKFEMGGETVELRLNYTAYRRLERDHVARRMPVGVFDLLVAVWLCARPCMDGVSRTFPFTHVQLLLYYSAFNARIGQHRDNNNSRDFKLFWDGLRSGPSDTGNCVSHGQENSQTPGSWVAVFTTGTGEMMCSLRYPPKDDPYCNREYYIQHPSFTIPLGYGTLFLMSPMDDLYFTHQADFETHFAFEGDAHIGDSVLREAWVFRHLESFKPFFTQAKANKAYPSEDIRTAEKVRKKRRAQKALRGRQLSFSRGM
jgi:hypothetical protein